MINIDWRRRLRTGTSRMIQVLGSDRCFYAVLMCFTLQALWLALTARYPMAFDENFHFGLIKLHATQWLPFFTQQPPGADVYGAVARDPSYLYHFLMSLPYRLIAIFTHNTICQIIILRLINIGMFASSFFLFRRLLIRLGGSRPLTNTVLLLFSFMPIVPFLAAQINYDNLLLPLTAAVMLLFLAWADDLKQQRLSFVRTCVLVGLLLLGCIVKYAFLPILAAVVILMLIKLWQERHYGRHILSDLKTNVQTSSRLAVVTSGILFCTAAGLFSQQYIVSVWRYHTPLPDCAQVLTVKQCSQYSPWQRNYTYAQQRSKTFTPNLIRYTHDWVYGMWQRTFFAISDTYATKQPLPVIGTTAAVVATLGGILFVYFGWNILKRQPYRQYTLIVLGIYVISLFIYVYKGYAYTGVPVAINGRYLVPFLPVVLLFAGLGFSRFLHRHHGIKTLAVLIVALCFLQGGAFTFIVQSDETWTWQSTPVIHADNAARKMLHPLIPGSHT